MLASPRIEVGVDFRNVRDGATHVWHLYVIKAERRDELKNFLNQRGIETAVHYPTALSLLPAYKYLDYKATDVPRAAANRRRAMRCVLVN